MTVVEGVLAFAFLTAVMVASATFLSLALLRRSAQISPRHRLEVPLRWMVVPSRSAASHRRLRGSVHAMRHACPVPRRGHSRSQVGELADEIEILAVAVDRDLLDASRQPIGQRIPRLAALSVRISRIEELAGNVARMAEAGDPSRSTPAQWHDRVDAAELRIATMHEAQAEVEDLERQLGLS